MLYPWRRFAHSRIPAKSNRKVQCPVDPTLYASRDRIECCFNKLKHWRDIVARHNETADSFMAFVHLAPIKISLRYVNRS
jgi:transposase